MIRIFKLNCGILFQNSNLSPRRAQAQAHAGPLENEWQEPLNPDDRRFSYQESRKRLAEERKKEYNDLLQAKVSCFFSFSFY